MAEQHVEKRPSGLRELPGRSLERDEGALRQLKALARVEGALVIITSAHNCGALTPASDAEIARCEKWGETHRDSQDRPMDIRHPGHFAQHPVEKIEGPDERGRLRAISESGDCWTIGYAPELLNRLQEAGRSA